MTHRFDEFQTILAVRDAGLLQLAGLALAALLAWLIMRRVLEPHQRDRLIALGAIVFHVSLLSLALGGRT